MASEIRVNRLSNRSGLSTITFANGGVQFSGITTFANGEFYVGTGATIINPGTNEFNFHTGGSNRFTINNSGANLGTGNITAVDATFTGNVSIGKTLTYEDVKNVDSVGVVTARTGVKITGGDFTVGTAITASSVTGNVTQDVGITTYSGSAVWFKGTTANKDMYWSKSSGSLVFKDSAAALFGDGSDLQLLHNGTNSVINNTTGSLLFQNGGSSSAWISSGGIIYTNNDVIIQTANGNNILLDKSDNLLRFGDNVLARFGNDNDLEMYHTGSTGYIKNTTGTLYIQDDSNIIIGSVTGSETGAKYIKDGAYELYHNNILKLATDLDGIRIGSGGGDNTIIDLHNASYDNGLIQYYNGSIHLKTGSSNGDRLFQVSTAGSERFRITSTGQLQATGAADVRLTLGSSGTAGTNNSVHIRADSADLKFMSASGGNTIFEVNGTETLRITSGGGVNVKSGGQLRVEDSGNSTANSTHTTGALLCNLIRSDTGNNNAYTGTYFMNRNAAGGGRKAVGIVETGLKVGDFTSNLAAAEKIKLTYDGHVEIKTDGGRLKIGAGNDLQMYHDNGGSTNHITCANNHHLKLSAQTLKVYDYTGNTQYFTVQSDKVMVHKDLKASANNSLDIGANGAKFRRAFSTYFVHRTGQSSGVGQNESEAIYISGGLHFFHDYVTLSTSNFTHGLCSNRSYDLMRLRNSGSGSAIYAENGSISSGSDYRMKENVSPITGAIDMVKNLKPCTYNIKKSFNEHDAGGTHQGFIAHEVQEAIPNIVNIVQGTKDAMEEVRYMEEDENIPSGKKPGDGTGVFTDKPDMQGIDYGHMTPILCAALKEAISEIETLKTKVAALEGS